jgi:hypothetical protein
MKNERKIIVFVILAVISFFGTNIGVAVAPTIEEITLSPSNPTPQSTITFSADISGDTPSDVWLMVEECNRTLNVCYPDVQNVSMEKIETGPYETNVTLKYAGATYITYWISVKSDGEWIKSSKTEFNLSEKPNGNQNGDDGNGNSGNNTPGFELVPFLIAVGLVILFFRRKRL